MRSELRYHGDCVKTCRVWVSRVLLGKGLFCSSCSPLTPPTPLTDLIDPTSITSNQKQKNSCLGVGVIFHGGAPCPFSAFKLHPCFLPLTFPNFSSARLHLKAFLVDFASLPSIHFLSCSHDLHRCPPPSPLMRPLTLRAMNY